MRSSFLVAAGLAALLSFSAARPGFAGDRSEADRLRQAGEERMEAQDWKGAVEKLDLSVKEFATEDAMFELGECFEKLARYSEAAAIFRKLLADFGASMSEQKSEEAKQHLSDITKKLIQLKIGETEEKTREAEKKKKDSDASDFRPAFSF